MRSPEGMGSAPSGQARCRAPPRPPSAVWCREHSHHPVPPTSGAGAGAGLRGHRWWSAWPRHVPLAPSRLSLYLASLFVSLVFLLVNLTCAVLVKTGRWERKAVVSVRVAINDSLFVLCAVSLSICLYKISKMSLANIYLESKVRWQSGRRPPPAFCEPLPGLQTGSADTSAPADDQPRRGGHTRSPAGPREEGGSVSVARRPCAEPLAERRVRLIDTRV